MKPLVFAFSGTRLSVEKHGNERVAAAQAKVYEAIDGLPKGSTIAVGDASGIDSYVYTYAHSRFLIVRFHPAWKTQGLAAGPFRNEKIVDFSDVVLCFHDGTSPGTQSTIVYAQRVGKPLHVFPV